MIGLLLTVLIVVIFVWFWFSIAPLHFTTQ